MIEIIKKISVIVLLVSLLFLEGCRSAHRLPEEEPIFKVLDATSTGLNFSNTLRPTGGFNVFDYMYFYNGGGIGGGDFNNNGTFYFFFFCYHGERKIFLYKRKFKV